jgi:hypothetical protein
MGPSQARPLSASRKQGSSRTVHAALGIYKSWIKVNAAWPLDGVERNFGLVESRRVSQAGEYTEIEVRRHIQRARLAAAELQFQAEAIQRGNGGDFGVGLLQIHSGLSQASG